MQILPRDKDWLVGSMWFFPGKEGVVVFAALILLPRPLKLVISGGVEGLVLITAVSVKWPLAVKCVPNLNSFCL